MKHQPLHDVIDPDVHADGPGFDYLGNDDVDAPNDAFVIGEQGHIVQPPDSLAGADRNAGPKRWVSALAFALGVVCIALTVVNLSRYLEGPLPPPAPTTIQVKRALYLGVMRVDAYRRAHGVTPESLADAGLPEAGPYAYQRIDPVHYVIAFRADGARIEYDSSMSKEQFFGTPKEILTIGGSQ